MLWSHPEVTAVDPHAFDVDLGPAPELENEPDEKPRR
jgi:hypothetical protein